MTENLNQITLASFNKNNIKLHVGEPKELNYANNKISEKIIDMFKNLEIFINKPEKEEETTNTDVISKPKTDIELKLLYPYKMDENKYFRNYIESLDKNKESLMKDLDISEEEYIELVQFSLAIIEAETKSGKDKKNFTKIRSLAKTIKSKFTGEYESPSLGISNLKMSNFNSEKEKELLKKYEITNDENGISNIEDDDQKAAIATIIRLKHIKDDYYNKYLDNFKNSEKPENRKVSLEEYMPIRWKGNYILETGENEKEATTNINLIQEFRKNQNNYVDKDNFLYILQIHNDNINHKNHQEVQKERDAQNSLEQLLNHDFHL